ncbi:AAA family ATPase [Pseudobacteriovorax antillogorgiicola]|uniref:histidine kinase n=1 Tax=Pseudobacteriovorax antillogorgiicola TaxID=1513793 RepID=A0A1Y6CTX5_9BACT|nr:AAA family ATPase [Pseudobacteriovorax antillogorgiicola]TCS44971.1 putative ATPase [Pseudobacteriovorax antillogorgiicola]SMF76797.1 Predicted ATPase [Pseudobacteriovorax antillogorgiicola]
MHPLLKPYIGLVSTSRQKSAAIFKARSVDDRKELVLKLSVANGVDRSSILKLKREYSILSRHNFRHAVKVFNFKEAIDAALMEMELVSGESLENLVLSEAAFPLDEFVVVAKQAIIAINEIHDAKLIHRNINPSQLIYNQADQALKIISFENASTLSKEQQLQSSIHDLEGNLSYISPEQTGRMNRSIDYRTDFYSLGAAFYFLLTGRPPFESSDPLSLVASHIGERVSPPSQYNRAIPKALDQVIEKLLAKEAEDRYQSAHGIIHDLELILSKNVSSSWLPGIEDYSSFLKIPEKLYGRESEIDIMTHAYLDVATKGRLKSLRLVGHSGIGKSSLAFELEKSVSLSHGIFISGKFKQFRRDVPFNALTQCMQQLVEKIMEKPKSEVLKLQRRLQSELSDTGLALQVLIPDLEQLMGSELGTLPDLGATENTNRVMAAFGQFIDVIASPDQPLVLFLDDIQWADESSLECLRSLFRKVDDRYLFLMMAYRSNEIDTGHSFSRMMASLEKDDIFVPEVLLQDLNESHISTLLFDTLKIQGDELQILSEIIFEKTRGNPFFVRQLLSNLYQKNYINYDQESRVWKAQIQDIKDLKISSNVVEFVLNTMKSLDGELREILAIGACIGSRFEFNLLAEICSSTGQDLLSSLWRACELQIIMAENSSIADPSVPDTFQSSVNQYSIYYKFAHDRIQQAAMLYLSQDRIIQVHLKLARVLFLRQGLQETSNYSVIFLAEVYNVGSPLVKDQDELQRLVDIYFVAAQKARATAAFRRASELCQAANNVAEKLETSLDADISFQINFLLAESLYYCEQPDQSEKVFTHLISSTSKKELKIQIYKKKIELFAKVGRFKEACMVASTALGLLNIAFPHKSVGTPKVILELIRTSLELRKKDIDCLDQLPPAIDERLSQAIDILIRLLDSSYQFNMNLYAVNVLIVARLALRAGTLESSTLILNAFGVIHSAILGNYTKGEKLSQAGLRLGDDNANPTFVGRALFTRAAFIAHWTQDVREDFQILAEAERNLIKAGEINWVDYCRGINNICHIFVSSSIDEMSQAVDQYAFLEKVKVSVWSKTSFAILKRFIKSLEDGHIDFTIFEGEDARHLQESLQGNPSAVALWCVTCAFNDIIFGRYQRASEWIKNLDGSPIVGMIFHPYLSFFQAFLSEIESCNYRLNRIKLLGIKHHLRKLSRVVPENFDHCYCLLLAETFRRRKSFLKALSAYEKAISASEKHGYFWAAGLASERAADLAKSMNLAWLERAFIDIATNSYKTYGASAKVDQISKDYSFLDRGRREPGAELSDPTKSLSRDPEQYDVMAIIRSNQAIAAELRPKEVLRNLIGVIRKSSGASHAALLTPDPSSEGTWLVKAYEDYQDQGSNEEAYPSNQAIDICWLAINDVLESSKPLILSDIRRVGRYLKERCIQTNNVKSLLVYPLFSSSQIKAIVYLENRELYNAFPKERLSIISILGNQATISIENAQLYESLEEKVELRTRQLQESKEQIAAILESMSQGLLTIKKADEGDQLVCSDQSKYLYEILENPMDHQLDLNYILHRLEIGTDTVQTIITVLKYALHCDSLAWQLNEHLLPREAILRFSDGRKKMVELDWNCVTVEENKVSQILLAIRDVTDLRHLQMSNQQQTLYAKKLTELLNIDGGDFERFYSQAMKLIDEIDQARAHPSETNVLVVKRGFHTLKGLSRMMKLSIMMNLINDVENDLQLAAKESPNFMIDFFKKSENHLPEVRRVLNEYNSIYETNLKQRERQDETDIYLKVIRKVQNLVASHKHKGVSSDCYEAIQMQLNQVHPDSIAALARSFEAEARSIACQLEKAPPDIVVEGCGYILSKDTFQALKECFVHLIRNAVDHGFETPNERRKRGKSESGTIYIHSEEAPDSLSITIRDDGIGLDIAKISNGNLSFDRHVDLNRIFEPDFSTKENVTDISGRGVGLNAIRSRLQEFNGEILVEASSEIVDGYLPIQFKIVLPLAQLTPSTEARRIDI